MTQYSTHTQTPRLKHSKSVSNITYSPDKHADGIRHQEGVIQDTKQRLIVVLVYRQDAHETMSFLHINIYDCECFSSLIKKRDLCSIEHMSPQRLPTHQPIIQTTKFRFGCGLDCIGYCVYTALWLVDSPCEGFTKRRPVTPSSIIGCVEVCWLNDCWTVSVQLTLRTWEKNEEGNNTVKTLADRVKDCTK